MLIDMAINGDVSAFLDEARRIASTIPVIGLVSSSTGMKGRNVDEVIEKPVTGERLRVALQMCMRNFAEESYGADGIRLTTEFEARASVWHNEIQPTIRRVAAADIPVLIQGETGVGKEVLARQLHAQSARAKKPFLKINCAALPSELIESELFGYERGAFTGAFKTTPGKFEMADNGSILLDEIGDMDFKLQAKLLQVLQDREFIRLGSSEPRRVDVRVLAATHCNLEHAIVEGRFREDLYYRLNIVTIHIPALRHRQDEILPMAYHFMHKYATPMTPAVDITPALRDVLLSHDWPGNVRELENVIRRLLVLRRPEIVAEDLSHRARRFNTAHHPATMHTRSNPVMPPKEPVLALTKPPEVIAAAAGAGALHMAPASNGYRTTGSISEHVNSDTSEYRGMRSAEAPRPIRVDDSDRWCILDRVDEARREAETEAILHALKSTLWNRKRAAEILSIDYKALLYKMKKLGIVERASAIAI
jgi:DNA-binding NtrC family response regulator